MSIFTHPVYQPIAVNKPMRTLGGLSRKDSIIALWQADETYSAIAKRLKLSRGAVAGAIQRYKIKETGFKPKPRGYYVNPLTANKTHYLYGYGKYVPFSHELDTHVERTARAKLKELLK